MRKLAFLLVILALVARIAPALAADPLTGRAAPPAVSIGEGIPFAQGAVMRLASMQRHLNDAISAAFRDIRENGSHTAIGLVLGLAFLYGVLHAIGPGHGKAVVASYFVANRARWISGIVMGGLISLIQGATAIVLVGLLAVVLRWRQFDVLNRATLIEFASYGLIAVLGAAMFYRAIAGRGCAHGRETVARYDVHHRHDGHAATRGAGATVLDRRLIFATGLTPCASAIIILLFALANHALAVGIAAVSALSLGMAITVSGVGVATVLGRRALLRMVDGIGVHTRRLEQGLSIGGALVIIAASGLLMAGAWFRL